MEYITFKDIKKMGKEDKRNMKEWETFLYQDFEIQSLIYLLKCVI